MKLRYIYLIIYDKTLIIHLNPTLKILRPFSFYEDVSETLGIFEKFT